MPERVPGIKEWVRSGTWMTGKSGTGQSTSITIGLKTVRTQRMKRVDATVYSD